MSAFPKKTEREIHKWNVDKNLEDFITLRLCTVYSAPTRMSQRQNGYQRRLTMEAVTYCEINKCILP